MKKTVFCLALLLPLPLCGNDAFLVRDGLPQAEIVLDEKPQRSARLAAQELQNYVEKISGAHLPIVSGTYSSKVGTRIFVGIGGHTRQLNLDATGLKDGAYRIVAGGDWLALFGQDDEFQPIEPWAKNNAEIVGRKVQKEWNQITGAHWGVPNLLLYKERFTVPGETGLPDAIRKTGVKLPPLELWGHDERGSFNAVCGFLQKLGVRWYAPGELGEVVPSLRNIPLPDRSETVRPDFGVRRVNIRPGVHGTNLAFWNMRLGARDPYGIQAAHGMDDMTQTPEILTAHPEWFALYGGQRQNQTGQRLNQLCYSNLELFEETVRNVRMQFDHFKIEMASVMPPDGYTAVCQCPDCSGKETPGRGSRGLASDYVWGFVNRVAKEVRKTHPDRKIINCAYGIYSLPPLLIEKLEPNVVVSIVGARRPVNNQPMEIAEVRQLRESWLSKTHNPIINFENYPFTDRGWYLPAFTPHAMGESINALKGVSQGEDVWLSTRQDFEKTGMGLNHFLVYFTQCMYWGGRERDIEPLFAEYCSLFYGPSGALMRAFFDYCETHWQEMEKDQAKADHALSLFEQARAQADPSSIYGRRLAVMDEYLTSLRHKSAQLGRKRGPVPVLRMVGEAPMPIVVDGKLDEDSWVHSFPSATGKLREIQTGRAPLYGTTVKTLWRGNDFYVAVHCEEKSGEKPRNAAGKHDDPSLWYGDAVEVLLETESHSYYQIAVSPSGAVADLDRSAQQSAWSSWDARAEVATQVGDGYWNVEIRLPVTADQNDPLHQVIGRRPTRSLPWHINVCRQRVREDGSEYSAFSPTGVDHFHKPLKFAVLYDGNSFEFPHDAPEDDFLEMQRAAAELVRKGRREEALAAFVTAADGPFSPLQQSVALEQAAALARFLRRFDEAAALAERVPLEPVKKTVLMQTLLDQAQAGQLLAMFGNENISAWDFWKRGDGFFARGRAHLLAKNGPLAEEDLLHAMEWTSEPRSRESILLCLAQNRENNLKDEDGALTRYQEIIDASRFLGTADQYYALHGVARVLAKRDRAGEALETLQRVDVGKLQGVWRSQFQLWIGDILAGAGRQTEARAQYQKIENDPAAEIRFKKLATENLAKLPQ
jgi:tetratricopeptide (TPR) repeat protein